ncbi:MAG: hypothetical protein ACI9S8_002840 [Chlamydiales bacterium]|jgi:hypothetical protein
MYWLMGPSASPEAPWQELQFCSNTLLPFSTELADVGIGLSEEDAERVG